MVVVMSVKNEHFECTRRQGAHLPDGVEPGTHLTPLTMQLRHGVSGLNYRQERLDYEVKGRNRGLTAVRGRMEFTSSSTVKPGCFAG
jgi:hypothetical protein